jgi:copper chaperone CopZ
MECDCKLIYDGYDNIRDHLSETYNIPEENWTKPLICPNCLNKLKNELHHLKGTVSTYSNLIFGSDLQKETIKWKRYRRENFTKHIVEVWVDNKCVKMYHGQDAIDCELGKIPLPKGAIIKTLDY